MLQEALKAMEKYKESRISFPSILETSDFLWFEVPEVRKSRALYEPYVIEEMSFEKGRDKLVTRMKMFALEDYTIIYKVIGVTLAPVKDC